MSILLPVFASSQIGGSTWRYSAAALADLVERVPGQPNVSFAQFSGFVSVSNDTVRRDIFYWFVESQRSPSSDPLILWTNGGPGCSGLIGKFTEMGPFRTINNGTSLDLTSYAWNREANVLFVEQPLFTGYSISDDPADAVTTDELNAARLTRFIDRWLDKFPGWRSSEFYLSAESYGGHYVPMTTVAILAHNTAMRAAGLPVINFRGALLGNPYTDPLENAIGMLDAAWGHGLMPTEAYMAWQRRCPRSATHLATRDDGYLYSYSYDRGADILERADGDVCFSDGWSMYRTYVGGDETVNPYALAYPVCADPHTMGGGGQYAQRVRLFSLMQRRAGADLIENGTAAPMRLLYSPCAEGFTSVYLNRPDVRAALHVDHQRPWAPCDDSVFDGYSRASHDAPMQPVWLQLIRGTDWAAMQMAPPKLLIFSGDNDAICGTHGTERWLATLGLNRTSYWEPWRYTDPTYGQQLGGYYTMWEGLHFATVRFAGHEVPAYRPAAAFELLSDFLGLSTTGVGARLPPPASPPPSPPPYPPGFNPLPPPPAPPPGLPLPPAPPASLFECGASASGSTRNRTNVAGNPAGDALLPFCVAAAGRFMFSSCGSDYDTWLRVFALGGTEKVDAELLTPDGYGEQLMSCDDCGPCGIHAVLHGRLEVGCYALVVDGYSSSEGDFTVRATCTDDGARLASTPPYPQPPASPPFPPGLAPHPPPPMPPQSQPPSSRLSPSSSPPAGSTASLPGMPHAAGVPLLTTVVIAAVAFVAGLVCTAGMRSVGPALAQVVAKVRHPQMARPLVTEISPGVTAITAGRAEAPVEVQRA